MIETPNPSMEELFAEEPFVNGDIGAAMDEIVRRLEQMLPDAVAFKNAQKGWVGPNAVRAPKKVQLAPAVLTNEFLNQVLVGVSVETSPEGIGGVFRNDAQVKIYSIDERIETGQQIRVHWQRAELIRLCLLPFLSGCVDASGMRVWRTLEPKGYTILPADWAKNYSGTTTTFRLDQLPNEV